MSGPAWSLRPAQLDDAPALRELELALFPEDSWSEQLLRAEIGHETRSYWIAQDSAETAVSQPRILGYAGVMVVGRSADVQNIAVVPQMRGRGLGSALLQRLHDTAVVRGADEVLLEVRESNRVAQSLYRRFGYAPIAQRPGYYPDGEAALIMRAGLSSLPSTATAPSSPSTTDLTSHMTGGAGPGASEDPTTGPRATPRPQEDPR